MRTIFFVTAFISLLSSGCRKQIKCSGFNSPSLTAWFPYSSTQSLVFQNGSGEQQTYTLQNSLTTEPYTYTPGDFTGTSGECFAEKVFQSTQLNATGSSLLRIRLSVTKTSGGTELVNDFSINLSNTFVLGEMASDTGFQRLSFSGLAAITTRFSTVTLGSRNYSDVVAAYRDTTVNKQPGIFQIYLAKGVGLVGYAEYPSKKLWAKQ